MPMTQVMRATSVEVCCLVALAASVFLWMYAEVLYRWPCMSDDDGAKSVQRKRTNEGSVKLLPIKHVFPKDEEFVVGGDSERIKNHSKTETNNAVLGSTDSELGTDQVKSHRAFAASENPDNREGPSSSSLSGYLSNLSNFITKCDLFRCLALDHESLLRCRVALRACVELGAIVTWFYFADRHLSATKGRTDGARTVKHYSRDTISFLFGTLVAAGFLTSYFSSPSTPSRRHEASASILSRDQTEEWKGWMQVLFLMYHYFAATEMYNAVRIFIAAYVWMTGYGNFPTPPKKWAQKSGP
jgi:hypothetical protein